MPSTDFTSSVCVFVCKTDREREVRDSEILIMVFCEALPRTALLCMFPGLCASVSFSGCEQTLDDALLFRDGVSMGMSQTNR